LPLKRHIKIGEAEFDAVFISRDISTLVDVTFLVTSNVSQKKIDAILSKVEAVKQNFARIKSKTKVKLLLVLVTQINAEDEAKLRASLATKFRSMAIDFAEIRLLDFEGLQRIFTED
jgi:tRNA threonylcarbamoyladenosine modification (KEOPS) complex  Pcc1 subunit